MLVRNNLGMKDKKMDRIKLYSDKQKGGISTGLILIVILLIVGFITYKSITKTHKRKYWSSKLTSEEIGNAKIDAYGSDDEFWDEYHWIAAKMYLLQTVTPRQEQPQITEKVTINGPIYNDVEQFGNLSMTIDPNGRITGSWEGKTPKSKDQNYHCKLQGYFYPEAECKDPSKLFMVGRVRRTQTIGDSSRPDCWIYIRGWLDHDYTANGQILFYDSNSNLKEGVVLDCTLIDIFNWEAKTD